MARKDNPDRVEDADVEIGASVKAKRLRFREKPKTQVQLRGELREPEGHGELETASGSARQNLPDEVEPGVTYRDVRVRWRAAARLTQKQGVKDEKQDEG
jgi:hypothetical protein